MVYFVPLQTAGPWELQKKMFQSHSILCVSEIPTSLSSVHTEWMKRQSVMEEIKPKTKTNLANSWAGQSVITLVWGWI